MYNVPNYTEQGGAKTVIGGTLEIASDATLDVKAGATVSGLADLGSLPTAAADTLGCVKVGTGLAIADGVLSANIPDADEDTKGLVKAAENVPESEAEALATLVGEFNDLLAALKAAGLMTADSESPDVPDTPGT
ncbi:MAG: hypothetical protein IJH75_01660 [Mogibacterium sp.]|nr:hypothetical protein [Mogibacterium sp.]